MIDNKSTDGLEQTMLMTKLAGRVKEMDAGFEAIEVTDANRIYRSVKHDTQAESVQANSISLKQDSNMNDVFLPIKATVSELTEV
jgi:tRNA threonylcarbamoyladenosine modification (KEOPS) complex  Pcc1 subunit